MFCWMPWELSWPSPKGNRCSRCRVPVSASVGLHQIPMRNLDRWQRSAGSFPIGADRLPSGLYSRRGNIQSKKTLTQNDVTFPGKPFRTTKNNLKHCSSDVLKMPEYLTNFLANLYINYNLECKALEAIRQAALFHITLKRNQIMISDIITVLPLALYHRVSSATLTEIMNTVNSNKMIGSSEKKNEPALRLPRLFQQKPAQSQPDDTPPQRARSLRDLPEDELIKKEKQ